MVCSSAFVALHFRGHLGRQAGFDLSHSFGAVERQHRLHRLHGDGMQLRGGCYYPGGGGG